jgi:hypothetical protein
MLTHPTAQRIEYWPIERLVEYPRNPRKNDGAVDRMCGSIREFGFKIPVLARSDGEVVDGHLRLKAARKLELAEIPVILCDEWTAAQVKAFRLLVNRSATWADFDEELLALELQEIQEADFDLSLTGFDPGEIDHLLVLDDEDRANAAPPLPETAVFRLGDLWLLGEHRLLCGDATSADAVTRLLGDRRPRLMVTDPPYGIELDSEWRDRAGVNKHGPAEASYMKKRTACSPQKLRTRSCRDFFQPVFVMQSAQHRFAAHSMVLRKTMSMLRLGRRGVKRRRGTRSEAHVNSTMIVMVYPVIEDVF